MEKESDTKWEEDADTLKRKVRELHDTFARLFEDAKLEGGGDKEEKEKKNERNKKLMCSNVAPTTKPAGLKKVMCAYGKVQKVQLKKTRGRVHTGFVTFEKVDDAERAMKAMDGKYFNRQRLKVCFAKKNTARGGGGSSSKKEAPSWTNDRILHTNGRMIESALSGLCSTAAQTFERPLLLNRSETHVLYQTFDLAVKAVGTVKNPGERDQSIRFLFYLKDLLERHDSQHPRSFLRSFSNGVFNVFNQNKGLRDSRKAAVKALRDEIRRTIQAYSEDEYGKKIAEAASENLAKRWSELKSTDAEKRFKKSVLDQLEAQLQNEDWAKSCKLSPYGSSANDLCFRGSSDLDICLCFKDEEKVGSPSIVGLAKVITEATSDVTLTKPHEFLEHSEKVFQRLIANEFAQARCFHCSKRGHIARDCPDRKRNMKAAAADASNGGGAASDDMDLPASSSSEDMGSLIGLAKRKQRQWKSFLKTHNLENDGADPANHSHETLKAFRVECIKDENERSFQQHTIVCAALRFCEAGGAPSILKESNEEDADDSVGKKEEDDEGEDCENVTGEVGGGGRDDVDVTETCFRVSKATPIISARIPILTLEGVSPKQVAVEVDAPSSIEVDICCGNGLALRNTALLSCYASVDPRVRPLCMLVKLWAKRRCVKDASNMTLSSYCYVMLVIFFLQSLPQDPILPSLQDPELVGEKWKCPKIRGCDVSACLDKDEAIAFLKKKLDERKRRAKKAATGGDGGGAEAAKEEEDEDSAPRPWYTLAHLLAGFFKFYGTTFDVERDVVCVRLGRALRKSAYKPHGREPPSWRMSVEDPFERDHDLGSVVVYREAMSTILHELRRASHIFASVGTSSSEKCGSVDDVLERLFAPRKLGSVAARLRNISIGDGKEVNTFECFLCGDNTHKTRECPQQKLVETFKSGPEVCFRCGGYGHASRNCKEPRRRRGGRHGGGGGGGTRRSRGRH
eukprot:g975.t1